MESLTSAISVQVDTYDKELANGILKKLGLKPKKAVTSNTITDFFEAEKMEHKKQRGYYLIRSRIL